MADEGSAPAGPDVATVLLRVAAELDIRDAIARYARAVDRRDERLLRTCFHDDAEAHYGAYDGYIDGFIDWVLEEVSAYSVTMHLLGQSVIDWTGAPGGSTAIVETYAMAMHRLDGGEPGRNWVGGIRYVDRFECRSGAGDNARACWRIAERTVVGDWLRLDPPEQQRRFGRDIPTGSPAPDDFVHRMLGCHGG